MNTGGLLSFGSPAYKCLGWHLGTWIWGGSPTLTDKSDLLRLNSLNKQYGSCWTTSFLLGVWNLGTCQQGKPMWSAAAPQKHKKNLWALVSNKLYTCTHNLLLWWVCLVDTTDRRCLVAGSYFPPDFTPWDFSHCQLRFVFFHFNKSAVNKTLWILWVLPVNHQTWGY